MRAAFLLLLVLGLAARAYAQSADDTLVKAGKTRAIKSTIIGESMPYEGSQFRDSVNAVMDKRLSPTEGFASLAPVLAWCDVQVADDRRQHFSIQNESEARELAALHPGKPIQWLDWACPGAYKAAAFLAIEDKDFPKALAFLDKAEAIAPLLAEPLIERGYLQTHMGDPATGVATYRRALALAESHPGSADMKATALRGLGFSLIEVGDLPAARKAYEQSLVVEPGNTLALDELGYLDRREAAAAKSPATGSGATPPSP